METDQFDGEWDAVGGLEKVRKGCIDLRVMYQWGLEMRGRDSVSWSVLGVFREQYRRWHEGKNSGLRVQRAAGILRRNESR